MAKSKNHTNHNQNRKAHRNGIKKPKKFLHESTLGSKHCAENEPAKYTYPIQMTNPYERESWLVSTDHCYARPWNWKSESTFLKPTKTLFMSKNAVSKPFPPTSCLKNDEEIDVEVEMEPTTPTYDLTRAKSLMEECDKHASLIRNTVDENWEDKISRTNWSSAQHRLFNSFADILNNFYLAKMAQFGTVNEPILRRTIIDKAVQRTRRLFATVTYDTKLLQWLHQLLIDNLDQQSLSSYMDILQTLKSKIPKFVEILLNNPNSNIRIGPSSNENLLPVLKKPWDPVATSLLQDKPKKLPGNSILVLVPCAPNLCKRNKRWLALLSHLGQVVSVPTNISSGTHRMTMTNCIDQMFALTKGRIQEVRDNYPNRHIILVGIGAGAALALQIAQVENVFCVVALGFSLLTVEGRRGEPDDGMLELQCPVLFVIGQCSSTSLQEDMEDLRERMRVETGFIVVGSADNNLIVNKKKKREEGITQSIVDRCITDEIGEFISGLILSPFPPQIRQSPTNISLDNVTKKIKGERKRFNSNTSSIESEPPSPTPKMSRPVGRPAGKIKSRFETKWITQDATASGISPLTPPPLTTRTDLSTFTPISSDATSTAESPAFSTTPIPQKLDETRQHVIKKIKTLKPVTPGEIVDKSGTKGGLKIYQGDQTRIQSPSLSRNAISGSQLSTFIQSGIKTIPPVQHAQLHNPPSTIKVLENVQLSGQATAKLISSPGGCPIDLSKLGITGQKSSTNNLVLLPDGKIKTMSSSRPLTMKTSTGVVLSVPGKGPSKRNKYIISKRFQNTISPRTVKRDSYVSVPHTLKSNLPPPTNLTTQDIMDLPIIFADDNQLLDPNMPTDLSTSDTPSTTQSVAKFISPIPTNKFVILTKPTSSSVKRANPIPLSSRQPTKFTKIILSKKSPGLSTFAGKDEVAVANISSIDSADLDSELLATTDPKLHLEELKIGASNTLDQFDPNEQISVDDDDPDYVPPKNLKL